jgi:hypothetical protein
MSQDVLKSYKKLLLSFLSVACIMFCSHAVFADTAAGCDPKVIKAQQARAQAKVCLDVAITNEMTDQPDSVLAMTCFNKSAGNSAKAGGDIFSGDFKDDLAAIIDPALQNFKDQFPDSEGKKDGTVDYTSANVTDGSDQNCDAMDKTWKDGEDKGINKKVPTAITDVDLQSDTPPKCDDGAGNQTDCGDDFKKAWQSCASQKVFSNYKDAVTALHKPCVPDFSAATSSSDVMTTALSSGSCPP